MLSLKGKQISGRTRTLGLALGAAVLGVTLAGATPAQAYGWHGGWHHGWDHGWYGPRVGLGFGVYPPAYYYPRPRVYYPPTYYAPQPYYPPQAYYPAYGGLNVTIPIR
jgi:hypothetical protein